MQLFLDVTGTKQQLSIASRASIMADILALSIQSFT